MWPYGSLGSAFQDDNNPNTRSAPLQLQNEKCPIVLCPACYAKGKQPAEHELPLELHIIAAAKTLLSNIDDFCHVHAAENDQKEYADDVFSKPVHVRTIDRSNMNSLAAQRPPWLPPKPNRMKPSLKENQRMPGTVQELLELLQNAPLDDLQNSLEQIIENLQNNTFEEYVENTRLIVGLGVPDDSGASLSEAAKGRDPNTGETAQNMQNRCAKAWIENPTKVYSALTFDLHDEWLEGSALHDLMAELLLPTGYNTTQSQTSAIPLNTRQSY